jgi:hypothetical protein
MLQLSIRPVVRLLLAFIAVAYAVHGALGQVAVTQPAPGLSVETKLAQTASFVPHGASPLEQLMEVARHYKLPMGIEWIEQTEAAAPQLALSSGATVKDLLDAILKNAGGYRVSLENGMLQVNRPALADDPLNLLNLRISQFNVKQQNLFVAQSKLRLAMLMTLSPKAFKRGYISDSGYPPGHVFDVNNVSVSGRNLSVRDILNRIASSNGNALWLVRLEYAPAGTGGPLTLKSVNLGGRRASGLRAKGRPASHRSPGGGTSAMTEFRWDFIPLTVPLDDSSVESKVIVLPQKP